MASREEMLETAQTIADNANLRLILEALSRLAHMQQQVVVPPPVVHLDPPDLSAIVTAVNGLKPGATADDIARAVQRVIQPPDPTVGASTAAAFDAMLEELKKIEFRLQGVAGPRAFGASGPSNISDNPSRLLGQVTVLNPGGPAPAQTRLLDYDVRSDANPVYVGVAAQGSATSAAVWLIQKLTYDLSSRLVEQESLAGVIWDNRATLPW